MGYIGDDIAKNGEGSSKINRKDYSPQQQAFTWMKECEKELKHYLSNPPFLSPLKDGENLYLYLVVSAIAVSVALVREENRTQLLVYYVSQAF